MVKVAMAHLCLLRFAFLFSIFVSTELVQSQLFLHSPIRPVFIVQRPNSNNNPPNSPERSGYPQGNNHQFNPANARSDLAFTSSEEDQNDGDAASGESNEKRNETYLPENFEKSVRENRPPLEPHPAPPLYGDPAIMEDEDEEQDRSRFLWPFSTTVTVSKSKAHPLHHHGHGHGHGGGLSHFPPGFPKPPHLPPHLQHHGHHGHGDHHTDLEYEKTRLKYEIYKLKAKKTIAILQNKVELKKILSLLLQQKLKALEWITWYHDYVEQMYNQANGWDSSGGGGGDGWDGEVQPLTDEEILHSKGLLRSALPASPSSLPATRAAGPNQKNSNTKSRWTSAIFGDGLLTRLRSSLTLGSNNGNNNNNNNNQPSPDHHHHQQQQQQLLQENNNNPHLRRPPPNQNQGHEVRPLGSSKHPQLHPHHEQHQQQQHQQTSGQQQPEKKKPFYESLLFHRPLLQYLGLGQKKTQSATEQSGRPTTVAVSELLRDHQKPQSQSQEQSEEDEEEDQEDGASKEENGEEEEEEDEERDNNDTEDETNDNEKSKEQEKDKTVKTVEKAKKPVPLEKKKNETTYTLTDDIIKNGQRILDKIEKKKRKEFLGTEDQEEEEEEEKQRSAEEQDDKSQESEEEVGKSTEDDGGNDKSEEGDDEEEQQPDDDPQQQQQQQQIPANKKNNVKKPKKKPSNHPINLDIDKELEDIEIEQRPTRLRTGTGNPSKVNFPTKKEKKRKKFQDKVYSFFYKTMDVLDKQFMNDDEEEVLDVKK